MLSVYFLFSSKFYSTNSSYLNFFTVKIKILFIQFILDQILEYEIINKTRVGVGKYGDLTLSEVFCDDQETDLVRERNGDFVKRFGVGAN